MRGLEEAQLNWWEQNLHHLPPAPELHAEIRGYAELLAGSEQNVACQIPKGHACSHEANNLLRIPSATFRVC